MAAIAHIHRAMRLGMAEAQKFNDDWPVGTLVRYFPRIGEARYHEGKTRTPAWCLPCGEVVVSVEGRSGGLCLDHIEVVAQ